MRYPGSEKLEIIRLVEQSHLPVRRTLAALGILPMTFCPSSDNLRQIGSIWKRGSCASAD